MNDRNVIVREATFEDHLQLFRLFHRRGLLKNEKYDYQQSEDDPYYYRWLDYWKANPATNIIKRHWPIGWVVENEEKKIVGCLMNIPYVYEFKGKEIIVACGNGFSVDPEYSKYSLYLRAEQIKQKGVDIILTSTAATKVRKILEGYGFIQPPDNSFKKRYLFYIDYDILYKNPIDKLMHKINHRINKKNIFAFKSIGDYDVVQINKVNDDFNVYWNLLKKRNNRFHFRRDADNLRWLLHYNFSMERARMFIMKNNGKFYGYAIFFHDYDSAKNIKYSKLVDLQLIDEENTDLGPLFNAAIKQLKADNVQRIDVRGFNKSKRRLIENLLPFSRLETTSPYLYKIINPELKEELSNPEVWDACLAEGDTLV